MRVADTSEGAPFPVARAYELAEEAPETRWLVRPWWLRAGVSLIAGHPKTGKTFFGLDLATSVASGTPFLGRFGVEQPGPALLYLAEDSLPQIRRRIEGLCAVRGLDLERLDLRVLTVPALRLDRDPDRRRLRATLRRERPRLLLLDPLVRLHTRDENSSQEMSALLGDLRELQREYDLALVLVHHAGKKPHRDPGQSLRGSSDLYAWVDSLASLARHGDKVLRLTIQHRSAAAPEPLSLMLTPSRRGESATLEIADAAEPAPERSLHEAVLQVPDGEQQPVPRTELRRRLKVNNERLGQVLAELDRQGRLQRTRSGWRRVTATVADPDERAGARPS